MDKETLDILVEVFLDERVDDILHQDQSYVELEEKINEQGVIFEEMAMGEEQRAIAENLISLHTDSIDFYAKYAYKQGFKDCLSLVREVGLIKAGDVSSLQDKVTGTYGLKK